MNYGEERMLYSDEDFFQPIKFKKTIIPLKRIKNLQIGHNSLYNIDFIDSKNIFAKVPFLVRNVILTNNTIGWGIFKDLTIQIDFKNNLFYYGK